MMTDLELSLVERAVRIRVRSGEDVDAALSRYPKLSEAQRRAIKEVI